MQWIRPSIVGAWGLIARQWRSKLSPSDDVPAELVQFYDISEFIPELQGALLSAAGLERCVDGTLSGFLNVCSSCHTSLCRTSENPPKFLIANGFHIGVLPVDLRDANVIERRLTRVTSLVVPMTIRRGQKHSFLKGHVCVITMDPTLLAVKLPSLSKEKDKFVVVIAGRLTTLQELAGMKRFTSRGATVQKLLRFYI